MRNLTLEAHFYKKGNNPATSGVFVNPFASLDYNDCIEDAAIDLECAIEEVVLHEVTYSVLVGDNDKIVTDVEHFAEKIDWSQFIQNYFDGAEDMLALKDYQLVIAMWAFIEEYDDDPSQAVSIATQNEYRIFYNEDKMVADWVELASSAISHCYVCGNPLARWLADNEQYLNDDYILEQHYTSREKLPSGNWIVQDN